MAPNTAATSEAAVVQQPDTPAAAAAQEWSVLNFYHLVDIADPDEVSRDSSSVINIHV